MDGQRNKEIVRRSIEEGYNQGDLAVVDELCHPDYVEHAPFPGQAPGPAGVKQLFSRMRNAFPDVQSTIEDIFAEGNLVVVRTTLRGTHQGDYNGLPATGRPFTIASNIIFRVAGGRIVERWAIGDQLGLLQQLGA
jgi:steroid delta-isomerase-like uncharacterized protein